MIRWTDATWHHEDNSTESFMMRTRSATTAALATLLILTASACGSDSEGADSSGTGADANPVEASETEPAAEPNDAEPGDAGSDQESAADAPSSPGGGTITMGDLSYSYAAETCFDAPGFVQIDGPVTNPGEFGDAEISISANTSEDIDDDGIADITADIAIKHTDATAPDLYSFRMSFSTEPDGINEGAIDFAIDGSSIAGTGTMLDSNGLLIPFGETMPFSFEASC
ncbi:MAG: hypothetical protein ACJAR2_003339 [Ilumatobacter sp.]